MCTRDSENEGNSYRLLWHTIEADKNDQADIDNTASARFLSRKS